MNSKVSYPRDKRLKEEGFDSFSSVHYARNRRFKGFSTEPEQRLK